ncbi:hypothetical protein AB4254_08245 [Vibrio breoganii]
MFRTVRSDYVKTALAHGSTHYFPYEEEVEMCGDRLQITYAFYNRNKAKWQSDYSYHSDPVFVKALFDTAIKRGLIDTIPSVVTHFLNQHTE